jgi:type I restriction enzyme R subunit
MMCVSSVEMLIKYYEMFKAKEHKLKIATIFSYQANEEDKDADGVIELDGEAKEVYGE